MAYNYGYPMNYYPMQPNAFQGVGNVGNVGNANSNTQNNGIIWVQGEAGAKSYMVAPNNTVQLWDSENQTIYLKSADASGMPSMRILDYTIRSNATQMPHNAFSEQGSDVSIREELNVLKGRIDSLQEKLESMARDPRDRFNKPNKPNKSNELTGGNHE